MKNLRSHVVFAVLLGLALRLFFVLHFPAQSGDTPIYEELATNWLKHGIYGLSAQGQIVPSDMRMPGYPGFLALIYALSEHSGAAARLFVLLAQIVIDVGTCLVTATLAAAIAPKATRPKAAVVAIWLAAICPFLANYTAVPLTETLATFFTGLALLLFVAWATESGRTGNPGDKPERRGYFNRYASAAAFFTGIATLFRPESPLLLIAFGLVVAWEMLRPSSWRRLVVTTATLGAFFLIPLLPWAARNTYTLHKVQFLAPRYAQLPSEIVPKGFQAWEKTWFWRMRDAYLVAWKLDEEEVHMQDIPNSAFDSTSERERVAALLGKYNRALALSKEIDEGFAALAAERTARHPVRTYLFVPLQRALTMWFTPRIELLPYSGHVFPLKASREDDPIDFAVTISFFLLNLVYLSLALIGARRAWRCRDGSSAPGELAGRHRALALIAVFIALRTAFLTTVEVPEPRYVLECFPAVLALAAFSFLPRVQGGWSRGKSGETAL